MSRVLLLTTLALVQGCGLAVDERPDATSEWARARRLWTQRDIGAYDVWSRVPSDTPEGREARRLLDLADARYREGVSRLRAGEPDARETLLSGVRIAPMDPSLYLELARACRDRGLAPRATEYYLKYLAARPDGEEVDAARSELRELGPELAGVFDPEPSVPVAASGPPSPTTGVTPLAVLAGVAFAGALVLLLVALRGRGVSLARLARESPELHPAIAYLAGSLRHELLKHRVGAIADALAAAQRGDASERQLAFLRQRLYGGQPLLDAWDGHIRSFSRALGHRLDLSRDQTFRSAEKALRRIASLERDLARGGARAMGRLSRAHERLVAFDQSLADLVSGLVRTPIDDGLLHGVVEEVRSEYAAGAVELHDLHVDSPPEDVEVEVFRVDLVVILKNILRNAILAVGRDEPPRRVCLDVRVELLPTGEEVVRIRTRDTSEETVTTESIYDRRADRGLGLVTAALTRYDGAIEVEPGSDGYQKGVVLRFFRALTEVRSRD